MSEHEPLPNPMPYDPDEREEVQKLLDQMDQMGPPYTGDAEARAKAETERIHQELLAGRSPQDILDELGGPDGARRVIGDYYTEDLLEEARSFSQKSQHKEEE
jgi:hypothetical protein